MRKVWLDARDIILKMTDRGDKWAELRDKRVIFSYDIDEFEDKESVFRVLCDLGVDEETARKVAYVRPPKGDVSIIFGYSKDRNDFYLALWTRAEEYDVPSIYEDRYVRWKLDEWFKRKIYLKLEKLKEILNRQVKLGKGRKVI